MTPSLFTFDLDGTLVSTSPSYRYSLVARSLEACGWKNANADEVVEFWFGTTRDQIIRVLFNLDPQEFGLNFARFDLPDTRLAHTRAFDDVSLLAELR